MIRMYNYPGVNALRIPLFAETLKIMVYKPKDEVKNDIRSLGKLKENHAQLGDNRRAAREIYVRHGLQDRPQQAR